MHAEMQRAYAQKEAEARFSMEQAYQQREAAARQELDKQKRELEEKVNAIERQRALEKAEREEKEFQY